MKKHPSRALLVLVSFACFVGGIISVLNERRAEPSPTPAPGISVETAISPTASLEGPHNRLTILVLGVDDLPGQAPRLQAAWLATFRLPEKQILLLGLPVHTPNFGQRNLALRDLFAWSKDSGPDRGIIDAVQDHVSQDIDVLIVMDEQAFSSVIDFAGGVILETTALGGDQVMSVLRFLVEKPETSLEVQLRLLNALRLQASTIGSTPDLSPLIDLIPEHAYCSIEPVRVVAMTAGLLPLDPAAIHVELLDR